MNQISNQLPICGIIPTFVRISSPFGTASEQAKFWGRASDRPSSRKVYIYPPRPLKFTRADYTQRDTSTPLSLAELFSKVSSMSPNSLLVILRYDSKKELFHIDPMEIISYIDYEESDDSLHLYSTYYADNKMIELSQLQSLINTNSKDEVIQHGKNVIFTPKTPLYLYSKSQGKVAIDDVITFSGSVGLGSHSKMFIGLVIYRNE